MSVRLPRADFSKVAPSVSFGVIERTSGSHGRGHLGNGGQEEDGRVYFGTPVFCHEVKDLEASKRFYEAKGMEVDDEVFLSNRQS